MEKVILDFARDLREAGIPAALPEIMDALKGMQLVGFEKNRFRTVLKSTLIKDEIDFPIFHKLFELYFEKRDDQAESRDLPDCSSSGPPELFLTRVFGCDGSRLGKGVRGALRSILASAVYTGSRQKLDELAKQSIENIFPLKEEDTTDFNELVYSAKASLEWFMFTFYLDSRREKLLVEEEEYVTCRKNLSYLEEKIKRCLEKEIINKFGTKGLKKVLDNYNLRNKDFSKLGTEEQEKIRRQAVKLGKKLATRKGRRKRPGLKGQTDLRNTIKRSMSTGGVPVKLRFKGRALDQPELLVLCDVSGSVAQFGSFMLLLVYSLQEHFRYVKSFLFIDKLAEATLYFQKYDPQTAFNKILEKGSVSDTNNSDFGRVFYQFYREQLYQVTHRTVILILADAKNNWQSDERLAFKEIARRAKKVYWLNPQPADTWNTRDCIMKVYAPYCDRVWECRNLEQLTEAVKQIFA